MLESSDFSEIAGLGLLRLIYDDHLNYFFNVIEVADEKTVHLKNLEYLAQRCSLVVSDLRSETGDSRFESAAGDVQR